MALDPVFTRNELHRLSEEVRVLRSALECFIGAKIDIVPLESSLEKSRRRMWENEQVGKRGRFNDHTKEM